MATVTVRNLDPDVQQLLKERATRHRRSMEAEARAILTAAVRPADHLRRWLDAAQVLRGDDLLLPERRPARHLDLS